MCVERPEYVTIPASWFRALRGNALRVASYFAGLPPDGSGRRSCDSTAEIADACGIRRDHVGVAVRHLEDAGIIRREQRGRWWTYFLVEEP